MIIRRTVLVKVLVVTMIYYLRIEGKENCFYPTVDNLTWTDNKPRIDVNISFSNELGIISSITIINDNIPSPIVRFFVVQQGKKDKVRAIYNVSTKLCDLHAIINAVPLLKPAKENLLSQSNYSFSCPLAKGVYVMNGMRIPPQSPILGLIYKAKRSFVVGGGLFEELSRGVIKPLTTYSVVGKIIKKPCGIND